MHIITSTAEKAASVQNTEIRESVIKEKGDIF